jgi:thiol-disulfide isomerase/thioredoxin
MRWLLLTITVLFAALAGCGDSSSQSGKTRDDGEPLAPVVDFPTLEKAVADQKGKVVVVDFWATWCGPCVKSFPHLVEIHQRYHEKGLVCIAASLDNASDKNDVEAFLEKHHVNFKAVILKRGQAAAEGLAKTFHYQGSIPHMVMFGRNGERVWDSSSNHLSDRALDQLIQTELGK